MHQISIKVLNGVTHLYEIFGFLLVEALLRQALPGAVFNCPLSLCPQKHSPANEKFGKIHIYIYVYILRCSGCFVSVYNF